MSLISECVCASGVCFLCVCMYKYGAITQHRTKRLRSLCSVWTQSCGGKQTWNGQPLGHGLQGCSQDLVFRNQLVHQADLQGLGRVVEKAQLQGQLRRPVAHRVVHGVLEPADSTANSSLLDYSERNCHILIKFLTKTVRRCRAASRSGRCCIAGCPPLFCSRRSWISDIHQRGLSPAERQNTSTSGNNDKQWHYFVCSRYWTEGGAVSASEFTGAALHLRHQMAALHG